MLHSETVSTDTTRSLSFHYFLASVVACWKKKRKPKLLIVRKTVHSVKRLCKCGNDKPLHLVQTLTKTWMSAGGSYCSVAAPKQHGKWKVYRAAVQPSLGIKNILFLLVPHTAKQFVSAKSSFSLISALPVLIRY